MMAGKGIDQLRRDAQTVAAAPYAALKDELNSLLASHLLHVDGAAFVGEGRIAGDDEDLRNLR